MAAPCGVARRYTFRNPASAQYIAEPKGEHQSQQSHSRWRRVWGFRDKATSARRGCMDDLVELLTVAERFQLNSGLVVVPDFSPPDGWKNRFETVTVALPDGKHRAVIASLAIAHFRISDPAAPLDRRWRLVVSFPELTKEDVPIGSKVMVPLCLWAAIRPGVP